MKLADLSRKVIAVTGLLLAAGCATMAPLDHPQDFPLHSTDNAFFDLDWRLDRRDGRVIATGLVEATRQGNFSTVWLELKGLDKEGHVVSKGLGRTWSGNLYRWQTQPFYVSLRPTGKEDRFELGVWSYDWASDNEN